jgi:hypothetical protein
MKLVVSIKGIINILGIEEENIKNYDRIKLKKEFNYLFNKYPDSNIYLKDDYGIYINGIMAEATDYLYAIISEE